MERTDMNSEIMFSVIMPTYNNEAFICRAINSLLRQSHPYWELIIVNDGSTDDTYQRIKDMLSDSRIHYMENETNEGLGVALNKGIEKAMYDYIAYLPADDFYYENHLETLARKFHNNKDVILVFSGIRYGRVDSLSYTLDIESKHIRPSYSLQLVQTAHKKTTDKWLERTEYVTADLFEMYWHKLLHQGIFESTGEITSFWVEHPKQRHKIIAEKYGGCLNWYRSYYRVNHPLRMRLSKYKFTDEFEIYKKFRKPYGKKIDGLKILLVGDLAYNPERIYALERAGHELYGLWVKEARYTFATVGPLPFGHVQDIFYEHGWQEKVKQINPDIIYALGNWDTIDLMYDVLNADLKIPFVIHFKEGPLLTINSGAWEKLYFLFSMADGRIFISEENKKWYELFCGVLNNAFMMDLDLPIKELFEGNFSTKLSAVDGEIHTVVTGRLVGVNEDDIKMLADKNIHLHVYTEYAHDRRAGIYTQYKKMCPKYFHIHSHISNDKWVREFSQYDAGWLHVFDSKNRGDLMRATWDDLNMPARIYTLAAAGLPMIQKDNSEHIVSMQSICQKYNIGIFYKDMNELGRKLSDRKLMQTLQENMLACREKFTFDYFVNDLTQFFRDVIAKKQKV